MESSSSQENENADKNFHCKNCKLAFLSYEQVSKHVRIHHLKDLSDISASGAVLQAKTSNVSEPQAQSSSVFEHQIQTSVDSTSTDYKSILEAYLKKNKEETVTGRGILEDLLSSNVGTSDSTKTPESVKKKGLDEAELTMMKELGLITDNLLDLYEDDNERLKSEDEAKTYNQYEQIETLSSIEIPPTSEINYPSNQYHGEIYGGPESIVSEEFSSEPSSKPSSLSSSEDEMTLEEKEKQRERNEEIRSTFVRKFGYHEYLKIDPYFQHLWLKSFEKKENQWQSDNIGDVIDEHMWANTEKR